MNMASLIGGSSSSEEVTFLVWFVVCGFSFASVFYSRPAGEGWEAPPGQVLQSTPR